MLRAYPRDVIQYARSSYYHKNSFIIYLFLTFLSDFINCFFVFKLENLQERLPHFSFLDVMSSCFPSLVPCLKFTLRNVIAKTDNRRQPRFKG